MNFSLWRSYTQNFQLKRVFNLLTSKILIYHNLDLKVIELYENHINKKLT